MRARRPMVGARCWRRTRQGGFPRIQTLQKPGPCPLLPVLRIAGFGHRVCADIPITGVRSVCRGALGSPLAGRAGLSRSGADREEWIAFAGFDCSLDG
jgi:hypothetical protein